MSFDITMLKKIIEGALLASGEPLSKDRLMALFPEEEQPEKDQLLAALKEIETDCESRGFELKQVASGWRFQVVEDIAPWVNRLWEEKPQKYSRAMMETLALIAYRQPITRGDIEEIRGVAVSHHIIKTLSERDWIKVVGHRDVPGRPSLFATTRQFLDYFNLKNLEDLPSLGELSDLEKLNQELDFEADKKLKAEGISTDVSKAETEETDVEVPSQEDESIESADIDTLENSESVNTGASLFQDSETTQDFSDSANSDEIN